MDKQKYNIIAFSEKDYAPKITMSGVTKDNDMWADIATILRILLRNGYQAAVRDDGVTVWVEFNYRDINMCGISLEWIDGDEDDYGEYNSEYVPEDEAEQ